MTNYLVVRNYINRRFENESGITVDYRSETLKTFSSFDDALFFARRTQGKMDSKDTLYINEKTATASRSKYYLTATKEGVIA